MIFPILSEQSISLCYKEDLWNPIKNMLKNAGSDLVLCRDPDVGSMHDVCIFKFVHFF